MTLIIGCKIIINSHTNYPNSTYFNYRLRVGILIFFPVMTLLFDKKYLFLLKYFLFTFLYVFFYKGFGAFLFFFLFFLFLDMCVYIIFNVSMWTWFRGKEMEWKRDVRMIIEKLLDMGVGQSCLKDVGMTREGQLWDQF